MGDFSDFQRGQIVGAFSWSICNQNGHFVRCIQGSSFQGYDDTHHGRTSPAKRNSGRKPRLGERDHCTLKRTVAVNNRNTAAKVTAELNTLRTGSFKCLNAHSRGF